MTVLAVWALLVVSDSPRPLASSAVALASISTLWFQERFPELGLGAAFAALVLLSALGFPGPDDPFLVLILWASYGIGRYARLSRQPWAAAMVLFFLSINVLGPDVSLPSDAVFPVLFTALPWLLGLAIQLARRDQQDAREEVAYTLERQAELLREATASERLNIARDLHDVAAHTLTAVSLQAQALRRKLEAGAPVTIEDAREIELAARQALADMRNVVGLLRTGGGSTAMTPQPLLSQLPALAHESGTPEHPVELMVVGAPTDVSEGLSMCAYRIVQEALTNARQHGDAGTTCVTVRWFEDGLSLKVESPADPMAPPQSGHGHGLIGMRERAGLYGGSVSAGMCEAGTWVVEAVIPIGTRDGAVPS